MRCFRDLAIVAAWVVGLLGLLEIGLRASGTHFEGSFYQVDPVRYSSFRPNAAGWTVEGDNFCRLNSFGMRDRERTFAKPPHTLRIAVVGDSTTAAQQVPLSDTVTQVMERTLSSAVSPGYQVEVLNFAVGGYSLAQMYLTMRDRIWAFHPDIALVFLTTTSIPTASRKFYRMGGTTPFFEYRGGRLVLDAHSQPLPSDPAAQRRSALFRDFYNRSALLQLAMTAVQTGIPKELAKLRAKPAPNPDVNAADDLSGFPFRSNLSPQAAETWHIAEGLIGLMHQNARDHGAEFWLVTHADERQCDPDLGQRRRLMQKFGVSSLDYTDNRLADFAARQGFPFIATAPGLSSYAVEHQVALHGFSRDAGNHGHLNVVGHRVTANIVAGEMLRRSPALAALCSATSALTREKERY